MEMKTKEEAREHCRFVGQGIEKCVAAGEDLAGHFEGVQLLRFKVEKEEGGARVVGGELGGDDSGLVISERGVTKVWMDEIVGYAFDHETRTAMVEFFETCWNA